MRCLYFCARPALGTVSDDGDLHPGVDPQAQRDPRRHAPRRAQGGGEHLGRESPDHGRYGSELRIKILARIDEIVEGAAADPGLFGDRHLVGRHEVSHEHFPKRIQIAALDAFQECLAHELRVFKLFTCERFVSLQGLRRGSFLLF